MTTGSVIRGECPKRRSVLGGGSVLEGGEEGE